MPIPISIAKILNSEVVEHSRIEFKEGWNPVSIMHTMCAFANDIENSGGGYLVVGVSEVGGVPELPPQGLKQNQLETMQKQIIALGHKLSPNYFPECEPVVLAGKHLLLIWAPGGYERPYRCPQSMASSSPRAYYIRRYANTIKAKDSDIKELHDIGSNVPFDDRINYQAKVSDIDLNKMNSFLREVGSSIPLQEPKPETIAVARALRIIGGSVESTAPLNVGIMLFNDRPDLFLREVKIEIVEIPDPTGVNMTERIFLGSLDRQLIDALAHIRNRVIVEKIIKHRDRPQADRITNYPIKAIEEVLANAIFHKSYQEAEPITVRVELNRIVITSCPGPDRSISLRDFKNGVLVSARYRNRRIGDFLKELQLVEGRNTGIPTVIRELGANGSPPVKFETDEDRTYFRVIIDVHPEFIQTHTQQKESHDNIKQRRSKKELRYSIVMQLEQRPQSLRELARSLGYSHVSRTLREVVNNLIAENTIEHSTAEKNSPKTKLKIVGKRVQND